MMVELSGRDEDLLMAKPLVPAVVAFIYGIYKFYDLGFSTDNYLYTYIPVVGSALSIISVWMYVSSMSVKPTRSISNMLKGYSGFIPYLFSLYLIGFLGLYSLWLLFSGFTFGTFIFGVVWVLLGYRMLYTFWVITEISVQD
jgi:hypothetical protein